MNNLLYSHLAFNNIKKNKEIYGPFILVSLVMVSLFYMLSCLNQQDIKVETIEQILGLANYCIILFIVIILFYINSFLMKYRTREFGLYNILGMDKKQIGKVLFWELTIVAVASIIIGLFFGILFSKFIFLVFINLTNLKGKISFFISVKSAVLTIILFICLYSIIIIYNGIRIRCFNTIELIKSCNVGEKEPKSKYIIGVLGFICLGYGYYLVVTCEKIIYAMPTFCKAVMFVIVGTYLIFISASIIFLKLLKNNKKFYYDKTNFITVSGMIYRMKKNAVGLASICILSTMVLISLSTTISLYFGIENRLENQYGKDDVISNSIYLPKLGKEKELEAGSHDIDLIMKITEEAAKKYHVSVKNQWGYYFLRLRMSQDRNSFNYESGISNDLYNLDFITIDDYNKKSQNKESLLENEVILIYPKNQQYNYDSINIKREKNKQYKIKKKIRNNISSGLPLQNYGYLQHMTVVLPSLNHLEDFSYTKESDMVYQEEELPRYKYRYNLEGKYEDKVNLCKNLGQLLTEAGIAHVNFVDSSYIERETSVEVYGNFLFIGIFFGIIFLISTGVIIYYKQISEGYEDRVQFNMMKKVGMSDQEIIKVIKRQVLMIFFLPILVAVLHLCFAFSVLKQILFLLGMTNIKLTVMCIIGTVVAFVMLYGISYILTSKVYYKMINKNFYH